MKIQVLAKLKTVKACYHTVLLFKSSTRFVKLKLQYNPESYNECLNLTIECIMFVMLAILATVCLRTGDDGPSKVHSIYVQYQDLLQNFQQAENDISRLRMNLVSLNQCNFCNYMENKMDLQN